MTDFHAILLKRKAKRGQEFILVDGVKYQKMFTVHKGNYQGAGRLIGSLDSLSFPLYYD